VIEARHWRLSGRVQGVGYRPFVHQLAGRLSVQGWVRNLNGDVEILAEGGVESLDRFGQALLSAAPGLARPQIVATAVRAASGLAGFRILPSDAGTPAERHLPADTAPCSDCLHELHDPRSRRHRHPFINCTQCGPRYTVIRDLPYDRINTSLSGFALCSECASEYNDPADRRFHAEPLSCLHCGPQLLYVHAAGAVRDTASALAAAVEALRSGRIVAAKGVGGYHLLCDARNDAAVERLRSRKPRPDKPLAVMVPQRGADGLDLARELVVLTDPEARLLRDPSRPILLARRRQSACLADRIAPRLDELGILLPYSPLHELLVEDFGAPLVVTSGNVAGEPVLTGNDEASRRLAHVADSFLHHDRPIVRPAEDSVWRTLAGSPRPLRLGRGAAPIELDLPWKLDVPTLAVGGHLKNTIALAWAGRCVVSPHIGDLGGLGAQQVFEQTITDLQRLYRVTPGRVVHDAHPDYATTRWARSCGLPATPVWHHRAHASALAGEYPEIRRWLVFAWDGSGFGEDGTLWGGEALLGQAGCWQRVASLRPFRLPGGERAAREPWRTAQSLCWEAGIDWPDAPPATALLKTAWERGVNAPWTSSVGRLFDAAAALTGILHRSSYEGQAPMLLEAAAGAATGNAVLPFERDTQGVWRCDWSPLLPSLLDTQNPRNRRAAGFHACLARTIVALAERVRQGEGPFTIGLTGGVFQNRLLAETTVALLQEAGFDVYLPQRLPCNDAGLAFGQIIDATAP